MSDAKKLQAKGIRQFENHEFEDALATFQEAIPAFESEEDPLGAAEMRVNIGLCHRSMEAYDDAIEQMNAGLEVFRAEDDQIRIAQALGNMALVYVKQDNHEQAETYYREAADIFRENGDDDSYGNTILALADMYFKAGDMPKALAAFEGGLEKIKNPNMRQKMAKQLLVVKNRLSGERKATENTDEGEAGDRRRRRRSLRRHQKSEEE